MAFGRTRYFYRTEGKRRVTVAYRHDPESGEVLYGASIFRQDFPGETYRKRDHRGTAEARLRDAPVQLRVEVTTLPEIESCVRQALVTHGVKARKELPELIHPEDRFGAAFDAAAEEDAERVLGSLLKSLFSERG